MERQQEEAEVAAARAQFAHRINDQRETDLAGDRRARPHPPGWGRPFAGVVMFDLRELAEWVGAWAPRPVVVTDVACGICVAPGVQLVADGEAVAWEAVYCTTCRSEGGPRSPEIDPDEALVGRSDLASVQGSTEATARRL